MLTSASLVELICQVDSHVHGISAQRVVKRQRIGMTLKRWTRIYNELLRFAGTPKAKKLISYTRD